MYNKDFGKHSARIRKPLGTRVCHSCGHKIPKGTAYLGTNGMQYVNICLDCCAEAYFRTRGSSIEVLQEQEEQKMEEYRKALAAKEHMHKTILEKEDQLIFEDRIKHLLRDYKVERILKFVLSKARGK